MEVSRAIVCAVMACVAAEAAPAAQRAMPTLAALDKVEAGLWEVHAPGAPAHNICVADPAALTQVRHGGAACARLVISDDASGATVHYSCRGAGWGRTSVRAASPTSVRIDTQGIADNAPFAFVAEARRIGACGAVRTSLVR
ncbi:MAG: hypothetical protein EOO78_30685 [Oxalobacteraceae bacterium]|nr:MAG: hypothetical protein EOO78_30685 [Oxalobacteraceae bacterium]